MNQTYVLNLMAIDHEVVSQIVSMIIIKVVFIIQGDSKVTMGDPKLNCVQSI